MSRFSAAKVQPQSGSHSRPVPGSRLHEQNAEAQQPSPSVHPVEPEDAYLTGTSRSLQRRVLGLNVEGGHSGSSADKRTRDDSAQQNSGQNGGQSRPHQETPAGQHATGSFTGSKRGEKQG